MSRYHKNRDPIVDDTSGYEDDLACRWFVSWYAPDGGTLEDVAIMFDLTRERIRQIEDKALEKLKTVCIQEGIDLRTIMRTWQQRDLGHPLSSIVVD